MTTLIIQSSARADTSITRGLVNRLADRIGGGAVTRELANGVTHIDASWVAANNTDPAERSEAQRAALALSDVLVAELRAADTVIIGAPIYNFGVSATLKAWIDQIARARETFRYTENGPEGLLTGKKAYVVVASGGTGLGSEVDFASGYLRHMLKFVGIADVTFIAADRLMIEGEAKIAEAEAEVDRLDLAA